MVTTATEQLSDQDLIKAYRAGDLSSFDQFILRHQDTVHRLAYRRLYDPDQTSDVVQEVFFRACKHLRKWRVGTGKPFTWLYRTTTLVCMEVNRKKVRLTKHFQSVSDSEVWLSRVSGSNVSPDGDMWVLQVLSELPERQREIMVLHFFEDLTFRDIAQALKISTGAVKASYSKGLKKLRTSLSEELAVCAVDEGAGR